MESKSESKDKTDGNSVNLSKDGKELIGKWGKYYGKQFYIGLDFKSDGSYVATDVTGVDTYDESHYKGKWSYVSDLKQLTMTVEEYVEVGEKREPDQKELKVIVKRFENGRFEFDDANTKEHISLVKQK
ncbi:DUF3994 domain-containing protein [Bacillus sp. S14(2024)]|uniref:DUF3994 domain-containing protein n=1 Tax=Bacillus sp. S14(2024) TaxID=3162884 RepID=UPI003D1B042E